MRVNGVKFSIAKHAAWAPAVTTPERWLAWAQAPFALDGAIDPALRQMPTMLRRRAGPLGKMALEVAYECLDGRSGVPSVFCSRHGDVARAVELLSDLAQDALVSPTGFGLAVHNASAGLFSIARADQASHVALAAGASSIEHAVIDACGLLADGAPMVLLVAYDCPLPPPLSRFEDCAEQPHAWAWLMVPPAHDAIGLAWSEGSAAAAPAAGAMPATLEVLRFFLAGEASMERADGPRRWHWTRDA